MSGDRRHPEERRFPGLTSLVRTTATVERNDKITKATRYFIASARLTPECAAQTIRNHWGIESMHWGDGCRLWGRPVSPVARPWRAEHGSRPPARLQHGARRKGQTIHQNSPQSRRMEYRPPSDNPEPDPALTWTRCRGSKRRPIARRYERMLRSWTTSRGGAQAFARRSPCERRAKVLVFLQNLAICFRPSEILLRSAYVGILGTKRPSASQSASGRGARMDFRVGR
jgi:hypothetical protein